MSSAVGWARAHLPRIHAPSVTGRARADLGPLVLAVLVVALAAAPAFVVPAAAGRAADRAVSAAVATAGPAAALVADVPMDSDQGGDSRQREPQSAALTDAAFRNTRLAMPPRLASVLRPPVAQITSEPLAVSGHGEGRSLVLAYVAAQTGDPRVTWTSGRPPASSVPPAQDQAVRQEGGPPWRVEVGLVEQAAQALGVGVGARLDVEDRRRQPVHVVVTGLYRVADARDPVWRGVPDLLRPRAFSDAAGHSYLDVAGLLSRTSLPDARLALEEDEIDRLISYDAEPERIVWENAADVVASVVQLQAGSQGTDLLPEGTRWSTRLDAVLHEGQARVRAAQAQATVLLAGLVLTAALVLALAADLLVSRRRPMLALARLRGASLAGLALELALESLALAVAGVVLGALVAAPLAGAVAWLWLLPVVAVAVLAGPTAGVRAAATATSARPVPANASARLALLRTRRLRRGAVEGSVAVVAIAAVVALRQRGVTPAGGAEQGDLLAAAAPAAVALAAALLMRRAVPPGALLAVRRAARSRGALPLVAAARLASTARALPFVVVATATALLALGASLIASERDGQALAAWRDVGADVRLSTSPAPAVARLAAQLARAPGVTAAVPARVADDVTVTGEAGSGTVRLVVADAARYADLLAATPLSGAQQLRDLARASDPEGAGSGAGTLPVLLRTSQPALLAGRHLRVLWGGVSHPVRIAGVAPAAAGENVLVADTRAVTAAALDATPGTVLVLGPGAERAVAAARLPATGISTRAAALRERESAPIPAALSRLAAVSSVVLVVLACLGVVLGAACGSRERGETLARLRTLGLTRRQAWQLTLGELLPPALVAALGGVAVGVLLARLSLPSLAPRLVTGDSGEVALALPWWTLLPALAVVASLGVVVAAETSARRRERLGLVLRVGAS